MAEHWDLHADGELHVEMEMKMDVPGDGDEDGKGDHRDDGYKCAIQMRNNSVFKEGQIHVSHNLKALLMAIKQLQLQQQQQLQFPFH